MSGRYSLISPTILGWQRDDIGRYRICCFLRQNTISSKISKDVGCFAYHDHKRYRKISAKISKDVGCLTSHDNNRYRTISFFTHSYSKTILGDVFRYRPISNYTVQYQNCNISLLLKQYSWGLLLVIFILWSSCDIT